MCFIAGLLSDWEGWEWMFDKEWNKDAKETNIACHTHTILRAKHHQQPQQGGKQWNCAAKAKTSWSRYITHFYLKLKKIYTYIHDSHALFTSETISCGISEAIKSKCIKLHVYIYGHHVVKTRLVHHWLKWMFHQMPAWLHILFCPDCQRHSYISSQNKKELYFA